MPKGFRQSVTRLDGVRKGSILPMALARVNRRQFVVQVLTTSTKQKTRPKACFRCGGDGLDCRRISAKRHSLRWRTEGKHSPYGARSREPTIIRRPSVNHLLQRTKKRPTKGVFVRLVEVVGVEPTSYSAAKKLSTYLVYLLFLNLSTRVNTL